MWLEDFWAIESSEGWSQSVEVSEAFKESVKRWQAGIKRTKKDEKKAKKHDFLLAGFLVKILIDKKYDPLLDYIFKAMDAGYPSNFILGILSLVSTDVSNKIREVSGKEIIQFSYTSHKENEEFDDHHIAPEVRERINAWVEDMVDVVSIDYSSVVTEQLLQVLHHDEEIQILTRVIFSFFLHEIGISISASKSESIAEFILWEVIKEIKKLEIEEV